MTRPRHVHKVAGMGGQVFDYRDTGLCPPNGGRFRPLVFVNHIPQVSQVAGTADFEALGRILKDQGLAIQAATDAEGNVALFTRLDEFCFGHLGANALACGAEHMHASVDEEWTEQQMRAAAWLAQRAWRSFGIPPRRAILSPGAGHLEGEGSEQKFVLDKPVGVRRRGHTSHENVSALIGSHARTDPGPGFSFKHLYELTRFFDENGRF
jgi:N-acetylmuramoyl-L-alanine amidase